MFQDGVVAFLERTMVEWRRFTWAFYGLLLLSLSNDALNIGIVVLDPTDSMTLLWTVMAIRSAIGIGLGVMLLTRFYKLRGVIRKNPETTIDEGQMRISGLTVIGMIISSLKFPEEKVDWTDILSNFVAVLF